MFKICSSLKITYFVNTKIQIFINIKEKTFLSLISYVYSKCMHFYCISIMQNLFKLRHLIVLSYNKRLNRFLLSVKEIII